MERNLVVALLLYFLVVMAWMRWQEARYPQEPGPDAPAPIAEATPPPAAPTETPRTAPTPTPMPTPVVRDEAPEEIVLVETSLYRAALTTRGAGIRRWQLTEFQDRSGGVPADVELVTLPTERDAALYTPWLELGLGDLREAAYTVERQGPQTVVFTRDADGVRIRKTYAFTDGSYDFRLRLELENRSGATLAPTFDVIWPLAAQESTDFADHGLVALHGDSIEREMLAGFGTPGLFSSGAGGPSRFDGNVDWAGAESRYFLSVMLPELPREAMASFHALVPGEIAAAVVGYRAFPLAPGQSVTREYRAYIGPKEVHHLEASGAQLQRSLRLGWSFIAPVARLFNWLLQAMYSLVPNYGVAIILITILVKLVTAPLTHKSMKSMQRMAALQPKMKEIQEKYADDRQMQSQELMKLYREGGANPIAGCLPMLLQLPFFIGLYYALQSSIELRQAPFVFWIQDLSIPETLFTLPGVGLPVRVLPLVMGGSMLLSQRLTPTTMDPMQARMMNTVMPIMFTVLFYQFASGLVLYWLVNNLLQIGQQLYMNRSRDREQRGDKEGAGAKAKA